MAFASGSNPRDRFRRVSSLSSKYSKQSMWANHKPLIWLVLLVLSPSFQQSFGYHLAGRDVPIRADGIKLKGSEKKLGVGRKGRLRSGLQVSTDISCHKNCQPAIATCSLVSWRSGVLQFQWGHDSCNINSATIFNIYFGASLCSRYWSSHSSVCRDIHSDYYADPSVLH